MIKTILRLIVVAIIAWFLRDILNTIIPIPTESMVEGFLDLKDPEDRTTLYGLRFLVWVFLLYLLLKYLRPLLFGFILPTAHRYAATKPLRRLQGVTAEFTLLGIVCGGLCMLFSIVPIAKKIVAHNTANILESQPETRRMVEKKLNEVYSKLLKNARKTNKYVDKKTAGGMSGSVYHIPTERSDILEKKDLRPNYMRESYQRFLRLSDPFTKSSYRLSKNKIPSAIDHEHLKYLKTHNDLVTEYKVLELRLENEDLPIDHLPIHKSEARSKTWNEFKNNPITFLAEPVKKVIPFALLVGLIIYFLSHLPIRYDFAGWYVNVLRFFEQGRFGFGGAARFAGLVEEWASLYKNQKYGLFMGRSLYNPFLNIGLEDKRHMLTIAGSRAGKGATAIIPNLLLWEGSALVIDPKGTNAAVTAQRRREMGHTVHLVDPFNLVAKDIKQAAAFNPLAHLDPDSSTIRESIMAIAEALVVRDLNQKETHWDDGAKTIIAGLIAHLVSWKGYDNPTLPMLRDMISQMPEDQVELWADMSLNPGAGRLAVDAAMRVIRGGQTNEILSIISNVDKHTEWLSSNAIQSSITSSTFSFAELKEKPTTIYLILPPHHLETHKRFLRLFINLAISQMSVGGRSKIPVLLLMDEFLALGRMEEVEKAFGLMAGYNLILWPFVQDFGRLKDLYGNSVNAFITNSRAVQTFGVFDEETTTFVSNQLGQRSLRSVSTNSKEKRTAMLRATNEVAIDIAADNGRQYILRAGKAPLLLEKVPYYDSTVSRFLASSNIPYFKKKFTGIFEGKYSPDPDYA